MLQGSPTPSMCMFRLALSKPFDESHVKVKPECISSRCGVSFVGGALSLQQVGQLGSHSTVLPAESFVTHDSCTRVTALKFGERQSPAWRVDSTRMPTSQNLRDNFLRSRPDAYIVPPYTHKIMYRFSAFETTDYTPEAVCLVCSRALLSAIQIILVNPRILANTHSLVIFSPPDRAGKFSAAVKCVVYSRHKILAETLAWRNRWCLFGCL
ncbi:hypothetical protein HYDPIDRAFT_115309 [Hydnomerulius pinastri MD-312]|uniref:Uncharacterized protein n=1 Tax=Hydnomerulius pinastri MD-312 TaxID=994086 RepID=A0A0C9V836_9AGAM|nr:hypothetical protein HYDPIDRAFT_115309 [Hydnomerulius pinastri MD-312]